MNRHHFKVEARTGSGHADPELGLPRLPGWRLGGSQKLRPDDAAHSESIKLPLKHMNMQLLSTAGTSYDASPRGRTGPDKTTGPRWA